MSMRFTFNTQEKNKIPQVIVKRPPQKQQNIPNIQVFKPMEKKASNTKSELNKSNKVEEILQELDSLIGLTSVKQLILEIQAFIEIQKKRAKENLYTEALVLHMIFKGNPGTGKTTVARIVGKLLREMGVLEKGHVIEVERADLVGEYIGHTAHKTRESLKKALGGVLFIDEAYSLARGGEKDFGKEAIDAMVKTMEDHKDNLILILAGYKSEMKWFLDSNPGLKSRFPIHIDFPDYTTEELIEIAELMLSQRQYQMTEEAKEELENILKEKTKDPHSGNARLVRNIIEKAIRRQALRLMEEKHFSRNDLILISKCDLPSDDI